MHTIKLLSAPHQPKQSLEGDAHCMAFCPSLRNKATNGTPYPPFRVAFHGDGRRLRFGQMYRSQKHG